MHYKKKIAKRRELFKYTAEISLNIAQADRISFSVLRNKKNEIQKIENVSYEIQINGVWEWVVRYDDHGGSGQLHRHSRISLNDSREIESAEGIPVLKSKNDELTWICKDIGRNYLTFRSEFLNNSGFDLY